MKRVQFCCTTGSESERKTCEERADNRCKSYDDEEEKKGREKRIIRIFFDQLAHTHTHTHTHTGRPILMGTRTIDQLTGTLKVRAVASVSTCAHNDMKIRNSEHTELCSLLPKWTSGDVTMIPNTMSL